MNLQEIKKLNGRYLLITIVAAIATGAVYYLLFKYLFAFDITGLVRLIMLILYYLIYLSLVRHFFLRLIASAVNVKNPRTLHGRLTYIFERDDRNAWVRAALVFCYIMFFFIRRIYIILRRIALYIILILEGIGRSLGTNKKSDYSISGSAVYKGFHRVGTINETGSVIDKNGMVVGHVSQYR